MSWVKPRINKVSFVFTFGKYSGKTVREVLTENPAYILWLVENDVADVHEDIVIEAEQREDE